MRRIITSLVAVLATSVVAVAQDVPALSTEQLTIADSAVSLASATVSPPGGPAAQYCRGILETAEVRARVDGTAPTASVGPVIPPGALVELRGADTIRRFQAIRTGSTSGVLALTCYGSAPMNGGASFAVTPAAPASGATTGSGLEVHATAPSMTSATIAAGALSGTFTGSPVLSGEPIITGRLLVRENFDAPLVAVEEDFTAKVLTDAGIDIVLGSPIGIIKYREEQAKTASSWVQTAGAIDISADDTTDNEGVEIYLGDELNTATGWIKAGTSGLCFEVNFTVALIAGTDQFVIGWRKNETFTGDNVYSGYADWAVVGINNVDGSVFANEEINGGAGAKSDDSGVNLTNASTHTLKSCILATGVPTAYLNGTAITMTNGSTALTAAVYLNPFISYLQAGGAVDAGIKINWMAITPLP